MKSAFEQIPECDTTFLFSDLVDHAVESLKPTELDEGTHDTLLVVALSGIAYLLELSSKDNAARGREEKQRDSLIAAIERHNEVSRSSTALHSRSKHR